MSETATGWARRVALPTPSRMRVLALLGTLALVASFVGILDHIVQVPGRPTPFVPLLAGSFLAATLLARSLRVRVAVAVAAGLLALGLGWYLLRLPYDPQLVDLVTSNLELVSGMSLLQIERAPLWALAVTPAPVFMTWYLALRRWYGSAVLVGGLTLLYFVLTGDAGVSTTLLGVVGGAAALGFGDLDCRGRSGDAAEYVVMALAVMIVVPAAVTVVPGTVGTPLSLDPGGDPSGTVEGSLLSIDGEFDIQGSIDLSTAERFRVTADGPRYWRVASFDRYTGEGWRQTGDTAAHEPGALEAPVGRTETLDQEFEVLGAVDVMPAAWRPIAVDGPLAGVVGVREAGGLDPLRSLSAGEGYRVRSAVPVTTPGVLANVEADYPRDLQARYTQLPASTPDRVGERTARITANAEGPYETATAIERWLEQNRAYSLDVRRPEGDVADAFLFEMDRGYCTYYATTMVTMLRTQDVPARMVTGYTPGQETTEDTYVVRGYNSHAWVEVYFPGHGWIQFDPTPGGPRATAERAALEEAGAEAGLSERPGDAGVDTPTTTSPPELDVNRTRTPLPLTDPAALRQRGRPTQTPANLSQGDTGGGPLVPLPSREELTLGAVAVVGLAAAVRRSGWASRAYRLVWLRRLPREDPETTVEAAHARLLYLLEYHYREREPGETPRQYAAAIGVGPRARSIIEARERLRHGPGVTADEAARVATEYHRLRANFADLQAEANSLSLGTSGSERA